MQQSSALSNPTPARADANVARLVYMKSVTLAEARQTFSALIAEVETFDEHVLITKNGRPTAVIISADEWEAIEDTAFWRSVPDIADDMAQAADEPAIPLDQYLADRTTAKK
jgi:antitoxin YefM